MKSFTDTIALITGGAGFIGYHLCNALLQEGARVIVYDNLIDEASIRRVKKLRTNAIFVKGDILDQKKLAYYAKDVDLFFHLAAKSSVKESYFKPAEYCNVNIVGTLNALESIKESKAKFIFASSSTVYGIAKAFPTPEFYPCNPISVYGITKLIGEEICQAYYKEYGIPIVCLRLFNVYGPEAYAGVIYDFLKKLKENPKRLDVIGSGEQRKDFIYIDDTINAILLASIKESAIGKTYNVGSGKSISVKEIARLILNKLQLKETVIRLNAEQAWLGDVSRTQADITNLKELGWSPKVQFEEGLVRTISWFRELRE